jgi:hypothetical protein
LQNKHSQLFKPIVGIAIVIAWSAPVALLQVHSSIEALLETNARVAHISVFSALAQGSDSFFVDSRLFKCDKKTVNKNNAKQPFLFSHKKCPKIALSLVCNQVWQNQKSSFEKMSDL